MTIRTWLWSFYFTEDFHNDIDSSFIDGWDFSKQITWITETGLNFFISWVWWCTFICIAKDTLDSVDYFHEVILLEANFFFHLFLSDFFVHNFDGQVQFIDDVFINDEIKSHVLIFHLFGYPLMKCLHSVSIQVFGFDFSDR